MTRTCLQRYPAIEVGDGRVVPAATTSVLTRSARGTSQVGDLAGGASDSEAGGARPVPLLCQPLRADALLRDLRGSRPVYGNR